MKANSPTHEEIARRAREIWQEQGNPAGRDTDIWFEAERQLAGGTADSKTENNSSEASRTTSESKGAGSMAERIKSETAAESVVEFNISPALPDEAAIQAALQKKEARAPQTPAKSTPRDKPAPTGKPLWNKSRSS